MQLSWTLQVSKILSNLSVLHRKNDPPHLRAMNCIQVLNFTHLACTRYPEQKKMMQKDSG